MLKVYICSYEQLPLEIEKETLSENGPGKEFSSYLLIYYNGNLHEIRSDASEPEDRSFRRDLRWIPETIMEAYNLGVSDGQNLK